jgi:tellurite resistance protein
MTPAWHMTFFGIIVAPIAAAPLGWTTLAQIVFFISLALAVTVWTGNVVGMARAGVPPPLRPTIAIHLAPVALLGIAASLLGNHPMALFFGVLAILLMALLLIKIHYLTIAGFTPLWGAFTFPMATFTNLMLLLSPVYGGVFWLLAGVALVGASIAISAITFRIIKMWVAGSLAPAAMAPAAQKHQI